MCGMTAQVVFTSPRPAEIAIAVIRLVDKNGWSPATMKLNGVVDAVRPAWIPASGPE